MLIGIPQETDPQETRVAGSPDTVAKLIKLGYEVCVQAGAGVISSFMDEAYVEAGAKIVDSDEVWKSDIVTCLDMPSDSDLDLMNPGSILICRMRIESNPDIIEKLSSRKLTGIAIDSAPRISRAQSLDVRSSMANLSGYKAVIEAANEFGRLFGGQMTAAGKVPPAKVYVIGVGVSGLAAIGTANSMGAVVSATDVRPEVADQVESLGGTFVEIPVTQKSTDGYAKEVSDDEQSKILEVYKDQAAKNDIIITTAQIPGRPSPLLLTADAIAHMKPGSVIVDLGASELGSNTELTVPDEIVHTNNGITIIGYRNLPNRLPSQASQLYGSNIVNLMKLVTPKKDGKLVLDENDEVIRAMTITLDGQIMWPPPKVSVSAKSQTESKNASDAAKEGDLKVAATDVESANHTQGKQGKGIWWKVLLGIVGVALILCAPPEMQNHFIVFELAVVVGFYVITNVTHTLHTPLMSVTNAISGIIIVGALLQIGSEDPVVTTLAFIAIAIASINIFGGFLVTNRMLKMFQRSSDE